MTSYTDKNITYHKRDHSYFGSHKKLAARSIKLIFNYCNERACILTVCFFNKHNICSRSACFSYFCSARTVDVQKKVSFGEFFLYIQFIHSVMQPLEKTKKNI